MRPNKIRGVALHAKAIARARKWRDLMVENGWTQKELAEHLNLTPSTVCQALKRLEREK